MRKTLLAALVVGLPAAISLAQEPGMMGGDRRPQRVELATPEVAVPLRLEKGRPVVEVAVNGKGPFPFVLDTGAGGTVLEGELVQELGLPTVGEVHIGDPIHPHGLAAKQVKIDRLAIGGLTLSGMTTTAVENSGFREHLGARGVLGMPLFSELLLTIDYAGAEVRIAQGELSDPDGKEILSFRQDHTIRVPITVGAVEIEADVDSGSPAAVSLPEEYMEKLPLDGKPVPIGKARTVTAEFPVYGATLKGAVQIGSHRLENPALRFNKLPNANIGGEILGRFAITIDQKNRRIRFTEKGSGPAAAAGAAANPSGSAIR
jgi:aspartyl protease